MPYGDGSDVTCNSTPEARYPDGNGRAPADPPLLLIVQPTQSIFHYFFRLAHDGMEMRCTLEALRVDLVDVLGARGSGRKPSVSCYDFQTPNGSLIAWGTGQLGGNRLACHFRLFHGVGRERRKFSLLRRSAGRVDARVVGGAELCRDFLVVLARVLASAGRNLSGQHHDEPILIGGPRGAVSAKKAGSGALFSAKAARAVDQSRHEPLEANRDFAQLAAKFLNHTVNQAAADHGLSNSNRLPPFGPMHQQIPNRHGEIMVR